MTAGQWIATAAALLSLMLLLVLAMMRLARADRRIAGRIATVTESYAPATRPVTAVTFSLASQPAPAVSLRTRLFELLHCDPTRAELYPVPWWSVPSFLLVALAILADLAMPALGWIGWAALPPLLFLGSRFLFKRWRDKRAGLLYRQMPDAIGMIVRAVRAGIPLTESFSTVAREAQAPTAAEFARLHNKVAIGVQTPEALWEMAQRNALPEYRFFAVAVSLQGQTGGNLAETLDNLADVIRKRLAIRARGIALTSEARSTAMVLAALPFVAAGALLVINPGYLSLLFTDRLGQKIFIAGCLALLSGVGSMQMIIKRTLQ